MKTQDINVKNRKFIFDIPELEDASIRIEKVVMDKLSADSAIAYGFVSCGRFYEFELEIIISDDEECELFLSDIDSECPIKEDVVRAIKNIICIVKSLTKYETRESERRVLLSIVSRVSSIRYDYIFNKLDDTHQTHSISPILREDVDAIKAELKALGINKFRMVKLRSHSRKGFVILCFNASNYFTYED